MKDLTQEEKIEAFDYSKWPTEAVPHVKSHGHICYDTQQGHYCPTSACEVNFQPRSLNLIFNIIDRGEYA